ncbi:helix-turn-helix domain-containing protein [Butyrivibrio sp. MB2005]|uniref:helix-turn-helix domain-containing protein n=1 Tax=Butyrivibrio sp. MB2005 TaxID=1280678 RepID=UPI00040DB694|nr:helix-turn-helix transcriptional regulator [Butyrivibrio sp. MB2005]
MNTNKELGQRIANLLVANNMKQKELADIVGVTEVSMSRYISGDRMPKAPILANIATALHTTVSDLLGTEEAGDFESEYLKIHRLIARNAEKMSPKQKTEIVNALFESSQKKG